MAALACAWCEEGPKAAASMAKTMRIVVERE